MLETADDVWNEGSKIRVKEPIAPEYAECARNQLLFTYLHLAPEPDDRSNCRAQSFGRDMKPRTDERGTPAAAYANVR